MDQADTAKLVDGVCSISPAVAESIRGPGYPDGYFNDRLVEVIDHLLATLNVPAPIASRSPKFCTIRRPALEQRSAGQKILMRMGPVNEGA